MAQGTIKFYKADKGFGFIAQENGRDIFFHISSVAKGKEVELVKGAAVSYEDIVAPDGRTKAVNVNILK